MLRACAGQLPQNIALRLKQSGVNVLGTDPEMIDAAEDRHKFSSVLDAIGVDQPAWTEVTSVDAAKAFAARVGCVSVSPPPLPPLRLLRTRS